MNGCERSPLSLVALALLTALMLPPALGDSPARAQTLFADDFEGYPLGTSFPCCYPGVQNPGGWELVYSGRYPYWVNQVIVADPANPGEQSLQLWGQPGWSAVIQRRFDSESPVLAHRYRIYITAFGGPYADHPSFWRLGGEYPPYDPWGTYYGALNFYHLSTLPETPDDHCEVWSEDWSELIGTWAAGRWIEVLVVLDRDPTSAAYRTYSVWLDGRLAAIELPLAKICRYVGWPEGWVCDGDKHPERADALAMVSAHAGVQVLYDDVAVFVPDAPFWIGEAQGAVAALHAGGSLNQGQANALGNKLEHALAKLAAGQPWVADNLLRAFLEQLDDLIADGVLTPEEGEPLRWLARWARRQIAA